MFHIFNRLFLPTFVILLTIFGFFLEKVSLKGLRKLSCLVGISMLCNRIHFAVAQIMEFLFSADNCAWIPLVGPSLAGRSQLLFKWVKLERVNQKLTNLNFFHQHSRRLHDVMQLEIEHPDLVQIVNLDFIGSLKYNGIKCPLTFDGSCLMNFF